MNCPNCYKRIESTAGICHHCESEKLKRDCPSDAAACSPPRELERMHKALQFIRPILCAIGNDHKEAAWRQARSQAALVMCDKMMIEADMAYPNHDFYAENERGLATAPHRPELD